MRCLAVVHGLLLVLAAGTAVLPLTPAERKAAMQSEGGNRRPGIPLDHAEQPYGFLFVRGAPTKHEVFRANFGGLIPCGSREAAWMPDRFGCQRVDTPVVSSRFAVAMRGQCTFATKAAYAQKAGAHGLIVVNSGGGLLRMPLGNRSTNEDNAIYLPSVMARPAFAADVDAADLAGERLTVALRPFREKCTPDDDYTPHRLVRDKISPHSPSVIAAGRKSPFVVEPPPGNTAWEPVTSTGGAFVARVSGSEGPDAASADVPATGEASVSPGAAAVRGEFTVAEFGGAVLPVPLRLVVADPPDACTSLRNEGPELQGAAVVVQRGVCPMVDKARRAQAANASAVVIVNNDDTQALLDAHRAAVLQLQAIVDDRAASLSAALAAAIDGSTPASSASGDEGHDGAPDSSQDSNDPATTEALAAFIASAPQPERVGLVRPVPESATHGVTVATVVVSAHDGDRILQLLADDTAAEITLQTVDGSTTAGAWDDVRALLATTGIAWPTEPVEALRKAVALVRASDPRGLVGSAMRMAALRAAALRTGVEGAALLHLAEKEVQFDERGNSLPHWSDGRSTGALPAVLTSAEPATAFLTGGLPVAALTLSKGDSFGCSVDGAVAHVRIATSSAAKSAGQALLPRLVEVLRYQACLEKLLLHNTAGVGSMLRLMQEEVEEEQFRRNTFGLFRRFGAESQDESVSMARKYMAAAEAVGRAAAAPRAEADERLQESEAVEAGDRLSAGGRTSSWQHPSTLASVLRRVD